ncbi:hypothetical protein [Microvirga rosea]|uniref:hypothetical protein n=1 Tax=Microvirga rosea TaxID=2715425 RepID=UPI001D0A674B|nr:hypothetical protein [Microvirga rosea]MCB8819378.1 hypothetical protein [Microvirga rosea]
MSPSRFYVPVSLLVGLFAIADPATAQKLDGVKVMMHAAGSCSQFSIGAAKFTCKGFVYSSHANGRIAFTVPTGQGAITLSGSKDSQLEPTTYTLMIDTVRAGFQGGINNYDAKGSCTMRVSVDGKFVHSLKCRATNGIDSISLDFKGNGTPVEKMI